MSDPQTTQRKPAACIMDTCPSRFPYHDECAILGGCGACSMLSQTLKAEQSDRLVKARPFPPWKSTTPTAL